MLVKTTEPITEEAARSSASGLVPNALLAVDVVLFTVRKGPIGSPFRVLLVNQSDSDQRPHWMLPGVLVRPIETFAAAARRAVAEEAGLNASEWYLDQLATFGEPSRDSRGRVASIAHLALVRSDEAAASRGAAHPIDWCPVDRLKERVLAFDHAEMIRVGIQRIRSKLRYSFVAFQLLPERFTLSELRAVYAAILDPNLARLSSGNFKKAMRPLFEDGLLRVVGRTATGQRGRPGDLYSFVGPVTDTRERELPW